MDGIRRLGKLLVCGLSARMQDFEDGEEHGNYGSTGDSLRDKD